MLKNSHHIQESAHEAEPPEPLEDLFEDPFESNAPPEATIARRAKSYSDFYEVVRAQLHKDAGNKKKSKQRKKRGKKKDICSLEALHVAETQATVPTEDEPLLNLYQDELLQASQQKYQYVVSERQLVLDWQLIENKAVP